VIKVILEIQGIKAILEIKVITVILTIMDYLAIMPHCLVLGMNEERQVLLKTKSIVGHLGIILPFLGLFVNKERGVFEVNEDPVEILLFYF
jgi:hypothetical protein